MRLPRKYFCIGVAGCGIAALPIGATLRQACAQSPQEHQTPAAPQRVLAPGEIHTESSRVYVHVGKTGLGHEHAVTGRIKKGVVHLGATKDAGWIVFDMLSFIADTSDARKFIGLAATTDASTRKKVTANMLGPDVLDVGRFATAWCKIRSSRLLPRNSRRGLPQYEFEGDFTLHGTTRPGRVIAEVEEKDGWLHIRGGFTMLQSQFGIKPYTAAFGAIGVADRLQIYGDLWVAKGSNPPRADGAVQR